MIAELELNISLLEIWVERMFVASWQGGILLALVWMICRFWKQLPASTRCWIWRIAYLKFVLVLMFGGLFKLPLLPASFNNAKPISTAGIEVAAGQLWIPEQARAEKPDDLRGDWEWEAAAAPTPTITQLPESIDAKTVLHATLFGIWIVGCAWSLVNVNRQQLATRRLVAHSKPFETGRFFGYYRILCAQLKLSSPPGLATTSELKSPIVAGAWRSTILIPESVLQTCGPDELGLIVAHELAHAKRRDLLWNWLPVLVRTCFFFHPLVWLTQQRYALDQEIACDCMALNSTRAQCREYGNLLVKVSSATSSHRSPRLAALGVASSFKTLRTRILEMHQFQRQTSQISRLLSITIVATGLFAIAPFDLVAQQGKPVQRTVDNESTLPIEDPVEPLRQAARSIASSSPDDEIGISDSREGRSSNLSISVSDGDVSESIQINSGQNGGVDVVFSKVVDGQTKVREYRLEKIEQLAEKDKQAYDFYKNHVKPAGQGMGNNGTTMATGTGRRSSTGRSGSRSLRQRSSRSGNSNAITDQSSDSSSQSSSSSAWERSSSVGRNGRTRNNRSFGTTGNGTVGGGVGNANQQLIQQINQMINQTSDTQMKDNLRRMLNEIQNN